MNKDVINNKFSRKDFPEEIIQFLNYELSSPSVSENDQSIEKILIKDMQFRTIYKQSPIGIEIYDSTGSLIEVNQACLDIFGVKTISEVRGFKLFEDPNLPKDIKTRIKNGETVSYEISFNFEKVKARNLYNTSFSGCIDLDVHISPIFSQELVTLMGYVVHVQDITDRKKTEKIKIDLEQRRENFVWMTSHELRTPLTVISGYTDFLLKNINQVDQDQQNNILMTIKRNITRLMKLTEQVAQLAQFNHGTFETKKVEFNFCTFINEAIEPYKTILEDQVDFEGCSIKTPVIIEGDKDRLLQVLDNLLNNSVKHTHPEKRRIKVNLEILPRSIRIKILDNGAGIAQRNIKRIFDQFVSIETEYSVTGTGIGLHVSQKIIEAHKGTIIAQSEGLGRGATFTIELPR